MMPVRCLTSRSHPVESLQVELIRVLVATNFIGMPAF